MASALRASATVHFSQLHGAASACSNKSAASAGLASSFLGSPAVASLASSSTSVPSRARASSPSLVARAAVAAPAKAANYQLPTWARFELGAALLYWESASGGSPASGELMTLWINPEASSLSPSDEYGIGFNGGFNNPIMCGGEPRRMTRKDRGPNCKPFYSIRINVPKYAKFMEFSFTDGATWDGPYIIQFQVPPAWTSQSIAFFNEGLRQELSQEGACDDAIFPDSAYTQDRCLLPAGIAHEQGQVCQLDLVPGCMDPSSPLFDPLANVDDGSCPMPPPPAQLK